MSLSNISTIITGYEARTNKASLSSGVENHVNSYSLWSSKASFASSGMESSSYFGAASTEAQDGLNDAGNIAGAVYDLEKAAFELMNMSFTENIRNFYGAVALQSSKEEAEKEAAKGNTMAAGMLEKVESREKKSISNVDELQSYAQKKADEAYEMKGNMAIFYDQTVMMFGGLKTFADENITLSSQTTDTRNVKSNDRDKTDMSCPAIKYSNTNKEEDDQDKDKNKADKDKTSNDQLNNKSNQSKANTNPALSNYINSKTQPALAPAVQVSTPAVNINPFAIA